MSKKVLTIRLPDELKDKLDFIAEKEGVSLNQYALYAFSKQVSEYETKEYFKRIIKNKSKDKIFNEFDTILKKIKSRKNPDWDKL